VTFGEEIADSHRVSMSFAWRLERHRDYCHVPSLDATEPIGLQQWSCSGATPGGKRRFVRWPGRKRTRERLTKWTRVARRLWWGLTFDMSE